MIDRVKIEKGISDATQTLYQERVPYSGKDGMVIQVYNDYEEMVFNLSEQTNNETISSIKAMSLGDRLKLQQLIVQRNKPQDARAEL